MGALFFFTWIISVISFTVRFYNRLKWRSPGTPKAEAAAQADEVSRSEVAFAAGQWVTEL